MLSKKGTIQGTVYNDRHGQAEQISRLAMTLFQGQTPPKEDLENERYIFLPYQKVTAENVESFMDIKGSFRRKIEMEDWLINYYEQTDPLKRQQMLLENKN